MRYSTIVERLLGAVFIVSALLKALDMQMFERQIQAYGLLEGPQALTAAAFGTVAAETLLGMALLAGVRLKGATRLITFCLLAGFTALVGYGWFFQDLDECGCFGAYVEMTPAVTATKNLVMMALLGGAWGADRLRRHPLKEPSAGKNRPVLRAVVASAGALAVLGGGLYGGYGEAPAEAERPFAEMTYQDGGTTVDLGDGEHFIAMYSANCEHCMATVPELHALMFEEGVPDVMAFVLGEPAAMDQFRSATQPLFPLERIGIETFAHHIGAAPPRFILVRDGGIVDYWDGSVPEAERVRKALTQEE
ncbi:MAG: hypothetical protein R6W89_06745 [Candidatus Hydrogenedentota bacterium]